MQELLFTAGDACADGISLVHMSRCCDVMALGAFGVISILPKVLPYNVV